MNPIDLLSQHIREDWPTAHVTMARPRHPKGVWSLDVIHAVTGLVIQWGPESGFGVSRLDTESYGEGPDENFSTLDEAESRIKHLLNPIYLAIDTPDSEEARDLIAAAGDYIGGVKIGLTHWFANDRAMIAETVAGYDWFLDVKLYDIPTQVEGALRSVVGLRPMFISLHTGEFKENANDNERRSEELMMLMAKHAVEREAAVSAIPQPKLLAVTIPTHLPATPAQVLAKAQRAISCGMDGIISSPLELATLRSELGSRPILMTPGITLNGGPRDEQQRTATAHQAMRSGANYLVIGRPITRADDPRAAAKEILDSLRIGK